MQLTWQSFGEVDGTSGKVQQKNKTVEREEGKGQCGLTNQLAVPCQRHLQIPWVVGLKMPAQRPLVRTDIFLRA